MILWNLEARLPNSMKMLVIEWISPARNHTGNCFHRQWHRLRWRPSMEQSMHHSKTRWEARGRWMSAPKYREDAIFRKVIIFPNRDIRNSAIPFSKMYAGRASRGVRWNQLSGAYSMTIRFVRRKRMPYSSIPRHHPSFRYSNLPNRESTPSGRCDSTTAYEEFDPCETPHTERRWVRAKKWYSMRRREADPYFEREWFQYIK